MFLADAFKKQKTGGEISFGAFNEKENIMILSVFELPITEQSIKKKLLNNANQFLDR